MNLKEQLALRKVATYRIGWIERKYLKRKMESCRSILKGAETKINYLPELVYFYAENSSKITQTPIDASQFRTSLTWDTFNTIILSLRTAWNEIHHIHLRKTISYIL